MKTRLLLTSALLILVQIPAAQAQETLDVSKIDYAKQFLNRPRRRASARGMFTGAALALTIGNMRSMATDILAIIETRRGPVNVRFWHKADIV